MGSEEDKERLVGDREGAKKIERDGKKTTQDIVREREAGGVGLPGFDPTSFINHCLMTHAQARCNHTGFRRMALSLSIYLSFFSFINLSICSYIYLLSIF